MKALSVSGHTHTPEDLQAAVSEGKMQAWQNGQSVVVTEVLGFPQQRVLNVFLAVGNLDEIMALTDEVVAFAKQHGCSRLIMGGRKGWAKVLPKYGWKKPRVQYELPLED